MTVDDKVLSKEEEHAKFLAENSWAIRPCIVYKDEYNDCTSFKGRFHQYFIFGENQDCTQWKRDHENCVKFEDSNRTNVKAAKELIESEEQRRRIRLRAHLSNDTWEKRKSPPEDWSSQLPDWIQKKNENTFLELKSKEMAGLVPAEDVKPSYCSLM